MKNNNIVLLFVLFLIPVLFNACADLSERSDKKKDIQNLSVYESGDVQGLFIDSSWVAKRTSTLGNGSYIEMNFRFVKPSKVSQIILKVVNVFEKNNPYLEVASWNIEKDQWAAGTHDEVYGIWIRHIAKK